MKTARPLFLLLALPLLSGFAQTQQQAAASGGPSWPQLQFLVGSWVGSAEDTPHGAGSGTYSFELQLNQNVVVRKNHAEYSSGVKHDDLMIIYLDTGSTQPKAIYFDTEGHTIHYTISFPAANKVVFESEAGQPGPRYRLTYSAHGAGLEGKFEYTQPNGEYKTYLEWTSVRAGHVHK